MLAATHGEPGVRSSRVLLEAGADPNARTQPAPRGWASLHTAILENNTPLVRLLLKHGADPQSLTQFISVSGLTHTPLELAMMAERRDIANILRAALKAPPVPVRLAPARPGTQEDAKVDTAGDAYFAKIRRLQGETRKDDDMADLLRASKEELDAKSR